jgi:glyoxylase-like metal-dependent hydrolase (beta-lactamase superfamily II)
MKILMNTGGIAATNCYLIADDEAKEAVLFDAPNGSTAVLLDDAQKRGWDVIGLWLTHGHFDHIADHAVVTARYPAARLLIHPLDVPKLQNPGAMLPFPIPIRVPPREPDDLLEDGKHLKIGSLSAQVIHTPGHSPGHVMFHFPEQQILVGGDLIIMGAVGRTDFADSSQADLEASIRRIMHLPAATRLLPGHGDISTLADEQRANPYVKQALVDENMDR